MASSTLIDGKPGKAVKPISPTHSTRKRGMGNAEWENVNEKRALCRRATIRGRPGILKRFHFPHFYMSRYLDI